METIFRKKIKTLKDVLTPSNSLPLPQGMTGNDLTKLAKEIQANAKRNKLKKT